MELIYFQEWLIVRYKVENSDAIQLFDEISEDEMISDDFFKIAIAYEK